jgi:hypothetical protein
MVPKDFRLESVAARLIARLEGARRTYTSPEEAEQAFTQAAAAMVRDASAEYATMGFDELASVQTALLEAEIRDTFLPRYTRLAAEMTRRETQRFGLGPMAEPLGRVATVVAVALFAAFGLKFALEFRPLLVLVPFVVAAPFLPDVVSTLATRRYERELQGLIDDMAKIQDQARAYAGNPEAAPASRVPPRPRQRETS